MPLSTATGKRKIFGGRLQGNQDGDSQPNYSDFVVSRALRMVLKRALADRLVLAAAFLVVLFAAMLVAAIPIYVNAVGQSGLRERLARAPVTEANVQVTAPSTAGDDYATLDRRVSKLARAT